jgi:uncharacterized membrane protein
MEFHHSAPYGDHGWWLFLGGFLPLVLFIVLIGLVVWAVLRFTGRGRALVSASTQTAPAPRLDDALHEVRLRYARGEMDRSEFVQRYRDLGGAEPSSDEPTPPPDS